MLYIPRHFIPNVSRIAISQLKFAQAGKHGGSGAIIFFVATSQFYHDSVAGHIFGKFSIIV